MNESYPPKIQEVIDTLALFPDRTDRIQYLISLAEGFREVSPEVAQRPFPEDHRVPQCESEAFVWAERRDDGALDFHFAVENPQGISAKAFGTILQRGLSGEHPGSVLEVPGDLVYDVFGRELSMGKNLGLLGMLQMCHAYAKEAAAKPPRTTRRNP